MAFKPLAAGINEPESFALLPRHASGHPSILSLGVDARGMVYGLLELADRVRSAADPVLALHLADAD